MPLVSYAGAEADSLRIFYRQLPEGTQRPKVGVVLAGGGAKGAAHIGVLMYLEEMGIPVDYVAGTSMGAIIGGLYALGYSPMEMNGIIKSVDWSFYMSNSVERRDMSMHRKSRKNSYILSIPFGTGSTEAENDNTINAARNYLRNSGELINDERSSDIINSLPSGFINGNNLINLFNDLCIGYQDSIDFKDLPIPYACVTTDMLDGSENVIRSGKIAYAMRSSMAIPIIFSPVEYENKLLVDGGMVNNFPTDICRDMGADIIIGVELSKGFKVDSKEINSLPGMLDQLMSIFTSGHNAENRKLCNIYIRPDVTGYGTMSFSAASIDSLVLRGYHEAKKYHEELALVKTAVDIHGPVSKTLRNTPAKYLNDSTIRLSSVVSNNPDTKMVKWINRKWGIKTNTDLKPEEFHKHITRMVGTGYFDSVTYDVKEDAGNAGSYNLSIYNEDAEPHSLDLGIRADTEEAVAVGIRVGFNENKFSGFKASLAGRLSYNPRFEANAVLALQSLFNLNLQYRFNMSHPRTLDGPKTISYSRITGNLFKFYISEFHSRMVSPAIGVEYHRVKMDQFIDATVADRYSGITDSLSRNAAVFGQLVFDNLDKTSFPTDGIKSSLLLKYRFFTKDIVHAKSPALADAPQNAEIMFKLKWFTTPGNGNFTLIPQIYHRSILCDGLFNTCHANIFGGLEEGRYAIQQMPFAGITGAQLIEFKNMTIARFDLRWKFIEKHYLTGMFNYITAADSFRDYFNKSRGVSNIGAALQYSYESKIGPISIDVHWSDFYKFGVYLSAGYYF